MKLTLCDLLTLPSLLGAYFHHSQGPGLTLFQVSTRPSVPASVSLSLDCLYSVSPGLTQACYLVFPGFHRTRGAHCCHHPDLSSWSPPWSSALFNRHSRACATATISSEHPFPPAAIPLSLLPGNLYNEILSVKIYN